MRVIQASTKLYAEYTITKLHSDCDEPLNRCSDQATCDMRHKVGCKLREGIDASWVLILASLLRNP